MKKITLLDGATGTRLWALAEAHGYEKTPTWMYNITHPELVEAVEKEYIQAGTKLICTNTFAANATLMKNAPEYSVAETVSASVSIAKKAVTGTDTKIALDIGPLSGMMEPFGYLTEAQATDYYSEQIGSGMDAGADCIFLETFTSLEMMRIAAAVAKQYNVPLLCSMSFERGGKTLMGESVKEIAGAMEKVGANGIGLNCSFGPDAAVLIIQEFSDNTELPLILKPNVTEGMTVEEFAKSIVPALPLVDYVGACCGSNPEYIRALDACI